MRGIHPTRFCVTAVLMIWTALGVGCAGLPRIDPSGERVFIWPNQQRVVAPAVGNPYAPPVYTDPVFPVPSTNSVAVPPPTSGPAPAITSQAQVAPETLTITPSRVLAPIGSEVILKAGICTDENFLVTDQKIEWLVARGNAGEIVSLGGRGWCRDPLLPWNRPKKVDNQYGIGYTAKVPLTITRGTADPGDDVQIEPGHAWASITSPVEGTSHVTAVAPVVVGWPQRRANATIYWVDVQWTFPPASVTAGASQVLTTNVRRQSDGTPLEGWIVRYEVADGRGAVSADQASSGASSQAVEVTTGIDGNASIDVTPTGGSGVTTQIKIQVVRPAGLAGSDMPRLVVANGTATVNWSEGSPYLPPADDLGESIPTYPVPDTTSPAEPSTPITPTPEPRVQQRPVLDVEIIGQDTGEVGGKAEYTINIYNRGDGTATGLVLSDRFQEGFTHPKDTGQTNHIEKSLSLSLGPGQSHTEQIVFDIVRSGNICHDVTVRCNEGSEALKRACMDVQPPPPQKQVGLEVNKDGVRQNVVGETTVFTLSVKNTGEVPLTDVQILDEYDSVFQARPRTGDYKTVPGNDNKSRFLWQIPRLEVGEALRFEVECVCLAPKQRACSIAQVTASGGPGIGTVPWADEHCIEIVEPRNPAGGGQNNPDGGAAAGLRLSISPYNPKPRANSSATYQFFVENATNVSDEQLTLRVQFPPEIVPDMATVKAPVTAQLVGNELQFNPIATIRPRERLSFTVTASARKAGVVTIAAQVTSKNFPQGVRKTQEVEIVGF